MKSSSTELLKYIDSRFHSTKINLPHSELFFEKFSPAGITSLNSLIRKFVTLISSNVNSHSIIDIESILTSVFTPFPTATSKEKIWLSEFLDTFMRHFFLFLNEFNEQEQATRTKVYKDYREAAEGLSLETELISGEDYIPKQFTRILDHKLKQKEEPVTSSLNHFKWIGTDKELYNLWRKIHQLYVECSFAEFKLLFERSEKKINWVNKPANKREVAHFFHKLCAEGFIERQQRRDISRIISKRLTLNKQPIELGILKRTYSRFLNAMKNPSPQIIQVNNIIEEFQK